MLKQSGSALIGEEALKCPSSASKRCNRREAEKRINSIPNFTLAVPDTDDMTFDIHFIALFSARQDAIPILMLHGWPGERHQRDL